MLTISARDFKNQFVLIHFQRDREVLYTSLLSSVASGFRGVTLSDFHRGWRALVHFVFSFHGFSLHFLFFIFFCCIHLLDILSTLVAIYL